LGVSLGRSPLTVEGREGKREKNVVGTHAALVGGRALIKGVEEVAIQDLSKTKEREEKRRGMWEKKKEDLDLM